jgi:hypothetical protein
MKPAGKAWVVAGVLTAAWVLLGFQFDTSSALSWLPKVVFTLSTLAPLLFLILYTILGLTGSAKWWTNDVGTNVAWLMVALIIEHGLICWAVVFNHGALHSPALAWAYVGSQLASALIVIWRGVIWTRAARSVA